MAFYLTLGYYVTSYSTQLNERNEWVGWMQMRMLVAGTSEISEG